VIVFAGCWAFAGPLLQFLLRPISMHLTDRGDLVFIQVSEPFLVYMKAAALAALFLSAPWILYQVWSFVAPGLYAHERLLVVPFLVFGTLFFAAGGAFGYYVAIPRAAGWLIGLGGDFRAALTLRSAFQFTSWILLAMGAVFELPILIFFLARMGVVTPGFLLRHFRTAVILMAVTAAVITPSGDMLTMLVFAGPMVALYLLGTALAWLFAPRDRSASGDAAS
jgi:sec-independent protein translocase protein TatC